MQPTATTAHPCAHRDAPDAACRRLLCRSRYQPDAACRMLRHALAYARNGLPIFPCQPENKRPFTRHGHKGATMDRRKICRWWKTHPGAMVGLPTGKASGIVAIDCDMKHCDGIAAFRALLPDGAPPLATRTHRTPSGGAHYLFRHPGGRVANTVQKLAPGVDTRGDGGYVVAPPSRATAGAYSATDATEAQPLPDWLLATLKERGIYHPDRSVTDELPDRSVTDEPDESDESEELEAIACASASPTLTFDHATRFPKSMTCPLVIVAETFPRTPGTRNRCALNLARGLKYDCGRASQPIAELKPFVTAWHRLAGQNTSSSFSDTWADFTYAFSQAKKPLAGGSINAAWASASSGAPHPAAVKNEYDRPEIITLVGACHALSRGASDGVFFISARSVQKLAGEHDAMTCWRWLRMLESDGVIALSEKGNQGHANRYLWTWKTTAVAPRQLSRATP